MGEGGKGVLEVGKADKNPYFFPKERGVILLVIYTQVSHLKACFLKSSLQLALGFIKSNQWTNNKQINSVELRPHLH